MVVDTSALLSVLFQEEDAEYFEEKLAFSEEKYISPFNALEADIVIEARKGSAGRRELELLFYRSQIDVLPFNNALRVLASEAWRRFGKSRHPAGLNLGDCCAYALSRHLCEPLLCKGEDFTQTDITRVV
jgi:ribonuclease VapC